MKGRVGMFDPMLKMKGTEQSMVMGLFVDYTMLLTKNDNMLQRIIGIFDSSVRKN